MGEKRHEYRVTVTWQGNAGTGTSAYRDYGRDHLISAEGKPDILASADPAFRGDPARWNPEDLFLASLSACHKLWYLHFCAVSGVIVTAYEDAAEGVMEMDESGGGRFTEIVNHRFEPCNTPASAPSAAASLVGSAGSMRAIASATRGATQATGSFARSPAKTSATGGAA